MKASLGGRVVICELYIGKRLEETFIDSAYFADSGEELTLEEIAIVQYTHDRELDNAHFDALEEILYE